VNDRLLPYLPVPMVGYDGDQYHWITEKDRPQSIGHLSAFMGNAGILLRAYIYARLVGREGMKRIADFSTLNANYLMVKLKEAGFDLAMPTRRATHEFIVTLKRQAKQWDVTAMDLAKRLLDYGFHAPTTYFPLIVAECLLIEPTETETKQILDEFVAAMAKIAEEAQSQAELVKGAPYTMPVRRLDDVKAARELDLAWRPSSTSD
jgi:glycine dehydrogenase subunit 2